jgi:Udp N-acetylglucosamine O-acyltransferase
MPNRTNCIPFNSVASSCHWQDALDPPKPRVLLLLQLAGHARLGDHTKVSGRSSFGRRVHVGSYAFVMADSSVESDVPPYLVVRGREALIIGVNNVQLDACGFEPEAKEGIRAAFQVPVCLIPSNCVTAGRVSGHTLRGCPGPSCLLLGRAVAS